MSASVIGLGHIGIYVQDLDKMVAFYRDFLGMKLTKRSDQMAFLSSDHERSDHEIALMTGRRSPEDPHLIQQVCIEGGIASFNAVKIIPMITFDQVIETVKKVNPQ